MAGRTPSPGRQPLRHQSARRILSGHHTRPRRSANRAGCIGIREAHSLRSEAINIGRLIVGAPLTAEIHPSQVIDQKEHHVRALFGGAASRAHQKGHHNERNQNSHRHWETTDHRMRRPLPSGNQDSGLPTRIEVGTTIKQRASVRSNLEPSYTPASLSSSHFFSGASCKQSTSSSAPASA